MRHTAIVSIAAITLALGGCGMFGGHHDNTGSAASYTPPASTAAAPTQTGNAYSGSTYGTEERGQGSYTSSRRGTSSGMNREEVRDAQEKLKDEGYYQGQIDGIAGRQTKQALMSFQKDKGLQQTGRLDEDTMDSLNGGGSNNNSRSKGTQGSNSGSRYQGSSGSSSTAQAPSPGLGTPGTNSSTGSSAGTPGYSSQPSPANSTSTTPPKQPQ
jgi:peptidoglycan hydrolase-like protein with peptidoglycan-binding domain